MVSFSGLLGLLGLLAAALQVMGELKYLGVAIAGIDFGCQINGDCPATDVQIPLASLGGVDSAGQMRHFVEDDGMNTFRLSMTWQYITAGQRSDKLDEVNWGNVDKLVQACLETGAFCMLDLHNFARYDGIIGQGGPTDRIFAALWTRIATFYAKENRIIFGLMNEPHELDVNLWAKSCQAAVTAIREAGANSQIVLLPGTNFASAETFVSSGSAEALASITNPDGSTDNLILDIHKYLDINNSGTHNDCTTNNTAGFKTISDWLRKNKRLGIVSETGASMEQSCMTKFCEQNEFIAKNKDVLIGFVGWAAGSFDSTYTLTLTPSWSGDGWIDNKLMKECILAPFGKVAHARPSFKTKARQSVRTMTSTAAGPLETEEDKDSSANQFGISTFCVLTACITMLQSFLQVRVT